MEKLPSVTIVVVGPFPEHTIEEIEIINYRLSVQRFIFFVITQNNRNKLTFTNY